MPRSPLIYLSVPLVTYLINNKLWDRQVTPEDSEKFCEFFFTGLNVFTETLDCWQEPTLISAYLQGDCKIKCTGLCCGY